MLHANGSENNTESSNTATKSQGIWVRDYALELFKNKCIEYRQMMLLSEADRFINDKKFMDRIPRDDYEIKPGEPLTIAVSEIARWLSCHRSAVTRMIKQLETVRLLETKRPKHGLVTLMTKAINDSTREWKLLIPYHYHGYYQASFISGPAVVLLSIINKFWSRGNECYVSDAWLGEQMGVKTWNINRLLRELESKELVEREHRQCSGKDRRYLNKGFKHPVFKTRKASTHFNERCYDERG